MQLRPHALDGALLYFDRRSGANLRLEGPRFSRVQRRAPRVVHLGLTNRCNLRCAFCFRDQALASRWSAAEVLAWAKELAEAGVLEIAFGQGEPLAFRGFAALVRAIHAETPLGVGFTTNGLLLDEATLDALEDAYAQIRLSFYEDNDPFTRAAMLARRGARFGANLLVTPESLPGLGDALDRPVDVGGGDALLLNYNGPDPRLHLSYEDDRRLARAVLDAHARHGDRLALKLSVCFGRRLYEVPRVFAPEDCGAGDDFLALDSEQRVLACSFHAEAAPARSAAEALQIWRSRRTRRAHAGVRGCAREGAMREEAPTSEHRVIAWRGWASNHSTSYTLVGELPSAAKAEGFVAELNALLDRCVAITKEPRGEGRLPKIGELLGREGPAWSTTSEISVESLALWRPPVIAAGGRRVLIHESSTLHVLLDFFTEQLLQRHGRVLWHFNDDAPPFHVVFGAELGDRLDEIAGALGRALRDRAQQGARLYGLVQAEMLPRVAQVIGARPWSFVPVFEDEEALAEAVLRPLPPPPKRHGEWMLLRWLAPDTWKELVAPLSPDATAALAEAGWHHPYRWPKRFTTRQVRDDLVVRVDGRVPAALQHWLRSRFMPRMQVVDREELRLRVRFREGYDDAPPAREKWARLVARISGPGGGVRVKPYATLVDIVPRDPMSALSSVSSAIHGERGARFELLPARPLADAIGRIQADLDGASGG